MTDQRMGARGGTIQVPACWLRSDADGRQDISGYGSGLILATRETPMARTYDDTCLTCGKLVPRYQGVAFRDGRIVDLPCYLDGTPDTHASRRTSVPPNQRLLGVHVLVIDDHEGGLELLRTALEYSGAFVTTATGTLEGKAILREVRPHVLVTDIAMPNNGLEMVRDVIVFAAETGIVIPTVAISAGGDGRHHLREAGFAAFIPKPLDPFVLAEVVAKLKSETAPDTAT